MSKGRVGLAVLPLHGGRAPPWLFGRMVRLAREVLGHVVADYGADEVLQRLSDPFWFQAFGCVLGFDWHSSGVTTTTCGAIKEAVKGLEADFGFVVAGGKGAVSRRTPVEIERACARLGQDPAALVKASRLSAKVDNTAVQDGHQLYHHCFLFTPKGSWCVIQQGMSDAAGTARRYHWLGDRVTSFVDEPHAAVCADARAPTLNLVAAESAAARAATTAIAARPPAEILAELDDLPLLRMPTRHPLVAAADVDPKRLHQILLRTYEEPPADFAGLLGVPGLGPKSLRALTLVAELVHGARASTRDPARFAFAHGGKDGTPFAVDRQTYDRTIDLLRGALGRAKLDHPDRSRALKRLAAFADSACSTTGVDQGDDQAGLTEQERHQPLDEPHLRCGEIGLGRHLALTVPISVFRAARSVLRVATSAVLATSASSGARVSAMMSVTVSAWECKGFAGGAASARGLALNAAHDRMVQLGAGRSPR